MEKYSVLMSVYQLEKPGNLRTSIQSMLNQTIKPDDFVIVCDGIITGDLNNVITEYEAKNSIINVVRLTHNIGLGNALNEGLKHCKYNLVARMDSDDISCDKRCEKQLKVFENQEIDICGGAVKEFDHTTEHGISIRVTPETMKDIVPFSKMRNPFNHPSVMFKKDAVLKAGGYKPFLYFEDYYLWVRMLKNGCIGYNIQDVILYMRSGSGMYQRRGGFNYIKCIVRFKKEIYKMGYTTRKEFLRSTIPHIIVALMPNVIRGLIYKRGLRK